MNEKVSTFYDWLHQPDPIWKQNLEFCDGYLFEEIKMSREELEKVLMKLDEYGIFKER